MMNKSIIFVVLLLFVSSCSYIKFEQPKSVEERLKEQGMNDFSISIMNTLKNCECSLDDDKQINCDCSSVKWDRKINIKCTKPPEDEYELLKFCKRYFV